MLKKIIFQFLALSLIFTYGAQSAENGGMPQLNPEFWISQIFWLILTFSILYIFLSKFILPKISSNLELRKSQIQENIEIAEKQRKSSDSKLEEYNNIILKSKLEAKNIFQETRDKAIKDINSKKDILDSQIDKEIKKVEQEVDELKKKAPEKISKIAIETSSELVERLIGAEVNKSSISAIVEDLTKKNGAKYYGN